MSDKMPDRMSEYMSDRMPWWGSLEESICSFSVSSHFSYLPKDGSDIPNSVSIAQN